MQFAPYSEHLGIKTWGVLKIAWHAEHLFFSDLNCQNSRLGTTGLWTWYVLVNFVYLAKLEILLNLEHSDQIGIKSQGIPCNFCFQT